tara:strand:+ start:681 stop:1289 length:609 start_codon:yes stop_codon:yes gene_type:complete
MSGALPNVAFNAININSEQRTLLSRTNSGKTFRRQIDGQRWLFTLSYPQLKRSDFAPVLAFIIKQRNSKEDFTVTFPSYLNAQGNETGTVRVNGSHSAGDTTIAMDGFAGDSSGRFKAGDFIKFAHSKVYMVVEDVTSSSNAATVTIEPPLTTALSDDEAVTYDDVPFTVFLKNDIQEFNSQNITSSGELLFNYEIDVEESI